MQYDKSIIAIRYWLLAKEYYKALDAMELAMSKHIGTRKDNITPVASQRQRDRGGRERVIHHGDRAIEGKAMNG